MVFLLCLLRKKYFFFPKCQTLELKRKNFILPTVRLTPSDKHCLREDLLNFQVILTRYGSQEMHTDYTRYIWQSRDTHWLQTKKLYKNYLSVFCYIWLKVTIIFLQFLSQGCQSLWKMRDNTLNRLLCTWLNVAFAENGQSTKVSNI